MNSTNFAVEKQFKQTPTMQNEFKDMETQTLIDMLARHTEDYTRLLTEGTREEYENCRNTIALLQKEINSRQQDPGDSSI